MPGPTGHPAPETHGRAQEFHSEEKMSSPLKMPPVNLPWNQGVIPGTERGHLPGDAPPRGLGVRAGRRDYCGGLEGRTAFPFVTAAARERSRTSKAACGLSANRTDTPCGTSSLPEGSRPSQVMALTALYQPASRQPRAGGLRGELAGEGRVPGTPPGLRFVLSPGRLGYVGTRFPRPNGLWTLWR